MHDAALLSCIHSFHADLESSQKRQGYPTEFRHLFIEYARARRPGRG